MIWARVWKLNTRHSSSPNLWLPRADSWGQRRNSQGVCNGHIHKDLLFSTWNFAQLYGSLDWRGVQRTMDTCISMAGSLHYSPESITTLLIGYTAIQNKKLKKNKVSMTLLLLLFSRPIMSDSLQPHGLQHARPLCPSALSLCASNTAMTN